MTPAADFSSAVSSSGALGEDGPGLIKPVIHPIGEKFLEPDGTLSKETMPDFLHLSAKGYQIWADAISPKVADLMK